MELFRQIRENHLSAFPVHWRVPVIPRFAFFPRIISVQFPDHPRYPVGSVYYRYPLIAVVFPAGQRYPRKFSNRVFISSTEISILFLPFSKK